MPDCHAPAHHRGRRRLTLLAALLLVACQAAEITLITAPPPPPPGTGGGGGPAYTVSLNVPSLTVGVGRSAALTATVRDSLGGVVAGNILWTSSNTGVAMVSGGVVSGIAAGTATVQASYSGVTASAVVSVVTVPVATVGVTPANDTIQQSSTKQLTATPRDANGTALSGRIVAWSTSNSAVATVSGSGLVRGVSGGVATITALSEGQTGTSSITVVNVPVATVTVAPASRSLQVGQTQQYTATTRDASNNVLTGRVITWRSSDTTIARVNGSGLVTARAIGGPVTITATSEGQSGTGTVTVVQVPVATVQVTPTPTSIAPGGTVQLTATTRDANGNTLTGRTITWATSNAAVANVSATGRVNGVATGGPVTITATSEGRNGTASVTVTGTPATLVRIILLPDSATVFAGTGQQFTASGRMSDSTTVPLAVTYSTNTGSISQLGYLTAGTTTGTFRVIAVAQGKADTSRVVVASAPPPGSYTKVVSDNWSLYTSESDPVFRSYWSFGASGGTNPPNVMTLVDLVPDGRFGQVARVTQPGGSSLSPQLHKGFAALPKTWVHFYIKFSPGWTAAGATGASLGNAWKLMHLYMPGAGSSGRTRIEVENGTQFGCGFTYPNRSYNINYLPNSNLGCAGSTELGSDKFQDGDWYEWIVYHETTGATTGRLRYWERRYTVNGTVNPGPWWFKGTSIDGQTSTDLFPPISELLLGINKNRDTPVTQYVYWGPWEVVNGALYPNPFGVGP